MSCPQHCSSELFNLDRKKLSKEEIEKIFAKYTKHFKEYMWGNYVEKDEEGEKKGERDKKDYN